MQGQKMTFLLLVILFITVTTAAALSGNEQGIVVNKEQQKTEHEKQRIEYEAQFPIIDYVPQEIRGAEKLAKRQAKGKKYDKAEIPVSEDGDAIFSTADWEVGLPALPVTQSKVIVMGEVIKAQAFLSTDKTGVYSEFTVKVENVLKNDSGIPLTAGGSVVADRGGGRVRFPSGHVVLSSIRGQGLPRAGRQYVLFLTQTGQEESLSILTGYEIRAGRMIPLDNPGGGAHPFAKYKDADEASFLNDLQSAIANPLQEVQ